MFVKYPRTAHIEGSRLQPGDRDLAAVPFARLAGRRLVVEEKLDGANAGISFEADGTLRVQSRGHYLSGGHRERHFALLKTWAGALRGALWGVLGPRYVMYGEWLYAKHSVFYDTLPHYFLEFDVLDRQTGVFLDTPRRRALLAGLPVVSVPVLHAEAVASVEALGAMIGPSLYKSPQWKENLRAAAMAGEAGRRIDVERVWRETDGSDLAEGLYVKVEEGGAVVERYKFIRLSFAQHVAASDHWLARPIVVNGLAPGVELFGGVKS
ncbi:MAG: RNA ligase family protein [Myxococcales bacterium]|nr:RNA ligase family protein [Myxococcales bacterium]